MNGGLILSTNEKLSWLRLIRTENIGPITFHQLIAKYETASEALAYIADLAKHGGARKKLRICSKSEAEEEFSKLTKLGAQLICSSEPNYPYLLRQIHDPPPVINVLGHPHLLDRDIIGIVGSRNASAAALRLTERFADDLGQAGFAIASGLARGIDAAAHHASLPHDAIAVVGGGIDIAYPKENQNLQEMIAERGCLLAEQPIGTQPQARHFPRRNRIISGLARAILVMEAAPKSGSLITARMALEQGRDIFAVPGSPLDPRARGTNNLIHNGALLVESAAEIIEELSLSRPRSIREPASESPTRFQQSAIDEDILRSARQDVISFLGPIASEIDDIIHRTKHSPTTVLTILLELELAGRLERQFGNRVSLID